MLKKITSIILVLFIVLNGSINVFAKSITLPYFGTTSESKYLWADTTYGYYDFTSISYVARGSATINYYKNVGGKATFISSSSLSGSGTVTPPGGTKAIKLKSNDGSEVYLTYAKTTNPNSTDITFGGSPNGGDGGSGGGGLPGNSNDCGCVFNTPGWSEYMSKIDDIIRAIPPPPDWNKVADTFRDKIVPKAISDLGNLLGRAPSLPSTPSLPSGPRKPSLPSGSLTEPSGRDGIGNAGFTSDDIKDQSSTIKEREDKSGGFDILDPIGQLPSQEDFMKNLPSEVDLIPPEVPDVDVKPAKPKEDDNIAPTPPEQENPVPGAPKEQENPVPGAPKEQENKAPMPPEQDNVAPIPGEDFGGFPIPGEDFGGFPIPGDKIGDAPIPGIGTDSAPIPKKDDSTAPIPGGD